MAEDKEKKKRIGVLGGTFDPVHLGHLQMGHNASETLHLDQVILLPAYAPPHKAHRENNADERLAMLHLAIENDPLFSIDEREMRSKVRRYTLDTMHEICSEYSDAEIYFILGEDSLMEIRSWYRWRELLDFVPFIVCPRPSISGDLNEMVQSLNDEGFHVSIAEGPRQDVSSTSIRQRIREAKSVRYLLSPSVLTYIERFGLYAEPEQRIDAEFLRRVSEQTLDFLKEEPYVSMCQRLKKTLKPHRYDHTMGVVRTAAFLAETYGASVSHARLAALLHDCAKGKERFYFEWLLNEGHVVPEEWAPSPAFHAIIGAKVARWIYGVEDEDVLQAIASHTTGNAAMTLLDRIIFLADEIEPSRDFDGVMELRRSCLTDLDAALMEGWDESMIHLIQQKKIIELSGVQHRNDLLHAQSHQ